jgi:hypothetical protein
MKDQIPGLGMDLKKCVNDAMFTNNCVTFYTQIDLT